MEEEIDLRQYIIVLIKYWYWIAGLAILAAVVAFVVGSFNPPVYVATALVTTTQSRYELQFDPRFQNVQDSAIQSLLESQYRTYPTLAVSDDLMQRLVTETGWELKDLQENLEAPPQSAPNLLALKVKGDNPEEIAQIANTWARLFVGKANLLFGSSGELEQFNQQQAVIAQSLAKADTALTKFREQNFGLLQQRLDTKNTLLTDYEARLTHVRQMQQEVDLLSTTLTANESPILVAGLLAEMVNTGAVSTDQPYQIKLDSVDPVAGLKAMKTALQSQILSIETAIETLQQEVNTLQIEHAAQQEKLEDLTRDRDVKAEAYVVISRKVQEAQIDSSSEGSSAGKVQVASQAGVPSESLPRGRLRNSAMAGVLGLMAGVFGAFALEWWRESNGLAEENK